MKIFTCLILILAGLSSGYTQQLVNYNFSQYDGNYIIVPPSCTCSIYKEPNGVLAVNNWDRSHGTPQVKFIGASSKPEDRVAYMYGYTASNGDIYGEGIFAGYTFLRNRTYKISMRVLLQANAGTLNIYATLGLQNSTQTNLCGEKLPSDPPFKKLIGTITKPNSGVGNDINGVFDFYFNPENIDLTQIWIYPTSPTSTQMDAYVDYVDIGPDCAGNIIYNTGTIPENISKAGYIYTGSTAGSGGSGTVSNVATASTFLQASNYIMIQPESYLAASGSGEVTVSITGCEAIISRSSLSRDTIPYDPVILQQSKEQSWVEDVRDQAGIGKTFKVFPSPSSGRITLSGSVEEFSNAQISVLDQSGREVYKLTQNFSTPIIHLNLDHLANGIYFIRMKKKDQQIIKKIIIQK